MIGRLSCDHVDALSCIKEWCRLTTATLKTQLAANGFMCPCVRCQLMGSSDGMWPGKSLKHFIDARHQTTKWTVSPEVVSLCQEAMLEAAGWSVRILRVLLWFRLHDTFIWLFVWLRHSVPTTLGRIQGGKRQDRWADWHHFHLIQSTQSVHFDKMLMLDKASWGGEKTRSGVIHVVSLILGSLYFFSG